MRRTALRIYQACFPATDECFLTACFTLALLNLYQKFTLTHFLLYRWNRAAPTDRGKSSGCQMMSVFGEDGCDGGRGWLMSLGREEVVWGK